MNFTQEQITFIMSVYMQGWNDYLDEIPIDSQIIANAYTLGTLDAQTGDDITSIDNKTTSQIIELCLKQKENIFPKNLDY